MKIKLLFAGNLLLVFCCLYLLYHHSVNTSSRVEYAYVETEVLVSNYSGMIEAKKRYLKLQDQYKSKLDSLVVLYKDRLKEFESKAGSYTPGEKKLIEELLLAKANEIRNFEKHYIELLKEEDERLGKTVSNEINRLLQEYGKTNNLKMIFSAREKGSIVFADTSVNYTSKLLDYINTQYNSRNP